MEIENFNFSDIVTDVIDHKHKQRTEYLKDYVLEINRVKPSSIGMCKRKVILDEMNPNNSIDDDLKRIFYHGNLIHDDFAYPILKYYFEEVLHIKNAVVINEYPLKYTIKVDDEEEIIIKGFIDNLILIDEKFYPIEIKSIGNAFYKLKEPKYEHKIQLMMYLKDKGQDFGYIVYIHKATLESKTFRIDYHESIFSTIEDRAIELYKCKRDGIIPEAEAIIEWEDNLQLRFKNACDSCNHVQLCLALGKDKVVSE